MADAPKVGFGPIAAPGGGVLVVFADDNLRFGPRTRSVLGSTADLVSRAAKADKFTGKNGSALDIVAPAGLKAARLVVIGTGKAADRKAQDLAKLGGIAVGKIPAAATEATVLLELADGPLKPDAAAAVALGAAQRGH
jgi:leucyl aminopeptidase